MYNSYLIHILIWYWILFFIPLLFSFFHSELLHNILILHYLPGTNSHAIKSWKCVLFTIHINIFVPSRKPNIAIKFRVWYKQSMNSPMFHWNVIPNLQSIEYIESRINVKNIYQYYFVFIESGLTKRWQAVDISNKQQMSIFGFAPIYSFFRCMRIYSHRIWMMMSSLS